MGSRMGNLNNCQYHNYATNHNLKMRVYRRFSVALDKYYKVLELQKGASEEEIKAAFSRLAKQYHPDSTNLSDKLQASKKFQDLIEARDVLLNKEAPSESSKESNSYEDFKRRQEDRMYREYREYKQYYDKRHHYEYQKNKERTERNQKAWEEHKAKYQNYEEDHSSSEAEKKLFVAALAFIGIAIGYSQISSLELIPNKPPPRIPKQEPRRGFIDPVTQEFVPRIKKVDRHVFYFEGEIGAHKKFLMISPENLGDRSLFKCMTCNVVVSKPFMEKHVEENRVVVEEDDLL